MKILCINQYFYPDSFGGVERVAYETMRRLAARGHDVHLVGQRTKPGTPDVEDLFGLTVHRYGRADSRRHFGGRTRDALHRSGRVMSRLLDSTSFDIVMPHHYFPYYAYLRLPRVKATPELMTFHASFWQELKLEGAERSIGKPLESLLFGRLAKRTETSCLKRADRVVVLSDFSREQLVSYYPFAREKVIKIAGGVDLEKFHPAPDRAAVRRSLGLRPEGPILFTARRLVPRMGVENLLMALAGVRSSFPEVLLVIAGRGRMEEELRRLVAAEELGDNVKFVGFVDDSDLVGYYQAADLFVLPSLAFEGFGMVTLEALACGTPVVGTPIGATPEILERLAPQLLLAGTEPHAIRRGITAMLEWLSDADAVGRLRTLCRSYVEAHYGWNHAVDALEATMDELLTTGGRHG
ncbi:glycosyltransferase family 4 protein [bacterium]|nr:glycosyltransferase family 4 protein [bacterium]